MNTKRAGLLPSIFAASSKFTNRIRYFAQFVEHRRSLHQSQYVFPLSLTLSENNVQLLMVLQASRTISTTYSSRRDSHNRPSQVSSTSLKYPRNSRAASLDIRTSGRNRQMGRYKGGYWLRRVDPRSPKISQQTKPSRSTTKAPRRTNMRSPSDLAQQSESVITTSPQVLKQQALV